MTGYIGDLPPPQSTVTRENLVANTDQTTFVTAGYTPGNIDVFLNGVLLDPSDYTADDGFDVVLNTGAALNDILTVVAVKTFEVADVVPASSGGTFQGSITVDGIVTQNSAFWENSNTITSDYTVTTGKNAGTFGPVTIADGVTVTIHDGSTWTVV